MYRVTVEALRALLDDLDGASVECDGMTRLVCTVLANAGIEHQAFKGTLQVGSSIIRPHFWVEVGEVIIDYRARMWLGNLEGVPHGVSMKSDLVACYQGEAIGLAPLSAGLFAILAMPWPHEDRLPGAG